MHKHITRLLLFVALGLRLGCSYGQVIDRIEVQRKGSDAEIRIGFLTQVQYQRHVPLAEGQFFRVFVRLTGDIHESELMQEHKSSPKTDLIPAFTLVYPELVNALAITFDRRTPFSVRQGEDGKSLLITVPAIVGAKDLVAEYRAPASTKNKLASAAPVEPERTAAKPGQVDVAVAPIAAVVGVAPASAAAPVPAQPGIARPIDGLPRSDSIADPPSPASSLTPVARSNPPVVIPENLPPVKEGMPSVVTENPSGSRPSTAAVVTPAGIARVDSVPTVAPPAAASSAGITEVAEVFSSRNKEANAVQQTVVPPLAAVTNLPSLADALPPDVARPAGLASEEMERQAQLFLEDARQLIGTRNGVDAILKLRQVLDLPRNAQTEFAQALIGEARELSGEISRARVEYEIYLKQYPNGSLATKVRAKLAELNKVFASGGPAGTGKRAPGPTGWVITGGISQYYYWGNSEIEVITPPPPGQLTFAVDRLSLTDQNALMTNLDVTARKRADGYDTRVVLRDAHTANFLPNQLDRNRLNSAYLEQSNQEFGYLVRAGRQTGSSGGVLGRFDGVMAGYNVSPDWKISGVFGYPVEYGATYSRTFYGASLDYAAQMDRPGFSTYYIQQSVDGVLDRQAVGMEARYFNATSSLYGMADYDLGFKGLNFLMLQGNWRTAGGTSYFSSIDHRRSPLLSVVSALPGAAFQSIQSLNQQLGLTDLRSNAVALTSWSNMFSIGVTQTLTPRWQVGTDYRVVSMTSTAGTDTMPPQPGMKNSHVISAQGIGNGLLTSNDVFVSNGSLILAPTYSGKNLGLTYTLPLGEFWRFDANLNYYTQLDNQEQQQNRISPSLKLSYRWNSNTTFEMNAGAENVNESGPLREMNSKRQYMYGGYRYDFR